MALIGIDSDDYSKLQQEDRKVFDTRDAALDTGMIQDSHCNHVVEQIRVTPNSE